jgi:TrmH family RNA methyltransferase
VRSFFEQARTDPSLAVVEGFHALKHALRFGADVVEAVAPDVDAVAALARSLAPDLADTLPALVEPVDAETFAGLVSPRGRAEVVAVARRPRVDVVAALESGGDAPAVLLDDPRDPGNLGAAIRVAAAAGARAVACTGDRDPWHPAAIRGAAGLQFALPVGVVSAVAARAALVAIDPGGEPLDPRALPPGAILAFGSERRGLSAELRARADLRVGLPMRDGVSSINLAAAVAAVLYAWRLAPTEGR